MNKVIIINGGGGVGKDTFVKLCKEQNDNVKSISTVDCVKEIAKKCEWDGSKSENDRRFLSDLKDALAKWNDIPFNKVINFIKSMDNKIIFIYCREPDEIERFCYSIENAEVSTLLIINDNVTKINSNHADAEVENYNYDYIIYNNGTIDNLKDSAYIFLKSILQ